MARRTHLNIADLTASVVAAPSKLFEEGNPKTSKGEDLGYLTLGLHLAPHMASGANLCSWATEGCIAACLTWSGQGGFTNTQRARIRKSKWFRADKQGFMLQAVREIRNAQVRAAKRGLTLVVRMNVLSDIPWENVRFELDGQRVTIFEAFPDVQFYDYTKGAIRFAKPLPANYDLTMSAAESNGAAVDFARKHGARVAVVYRNALKPRTRAKLWQLPARDEDGTPIVDGDRHDLRFLDPQGCIIGLKAKGLATTDESGFARDIMPAAA